MAPSRDNQNDTTQPPGKQPKAERPKQRGSARKSPPGAAASADQAPKSARRTSWLAWLGTVGAVAVAGVVVAAYLGWIPVKLEFQSGSESGGASAVAEIEARLGDLEAELARLAAEPVANENVTRLDDLNSRIVALELVAEAIADLARRLGALEERMTDLAAGDESAAARASRIDELDSLVQELASRIGEVEVATAAPGGQTPASMARSPALLLAIGPLRSALRGSGPFDAELAALRAIAGGDTEVEAAAGLLAPRAAGGVPTIAVLKARFSSIADQVVQGESAPDGSSWFEDWIASPVAKLVTVRSVGDVPGNTGEAVIARAEARLADDDLVSAVSELESLDGTSAENLAGWLADARARISAERALAALESYALASLATGGGGG